MNGWGLDTQQSGARESLATKCATVAVQPRSMRGMLVVPVYSWAAASLTVTAAEEASTAKPKRVETTAANATWLVASLMAVATVDGMTPSSV